MAQVTLNEVTTPAIGDEAIEVECLLLEPQEQHISVNGFLCFGDKSPEKQLEIAYTPCRYGTSDPGITQGKRGATNQIVPDKMPNEVEVANLQVLNDFSTCEDYLLDIDFAEITTNLCYGSSKESTSSLCKNQMPVSSCYDTAVYGISHASAAIMGVANCHMNIFGNSSSEIHGISSCKHEFEAAVGENGIGRSAPYTLQNMGDLENGSNIVQGSLPARESHTVPRCLKSRSVLCTTSQVKHGIEISLNGQNVEANLHGHDTVMNRPVQTSTVNVFASGKRLRKPTRRYIDESVHLNSGYTRKRKEEVSASTSTSTERHTRVSDRKECNRGASRAIRLFGEESPVKAIQVPFDSVAPRECRKRQVSDLLVNSDEETSLVESEDDVVTRLGSEDIRRRKHHRLWSVLEVRKLLDGVSQYGVGRWTQIKRLLFASSAHRTPVDLKDKWRNLLKACNIQRHSKKEDKRKHNVAWRPLPKSVLRRVTELANIHPYPRNRKSRISLAHHVTSSPSPS